MASVRKTSYRRHASMIGHFAEAIAQFAPTYEIGEDVDEGKVALQDSLRFVVQANGQGQLPRDVSAEVFDARGTYLLDEDEDEDDEEERGE